MTSRREQTRERQFRAVSGAGVLGQCDAPTESQRHSHNRHLGFHRANARAADVSSTLKALEAGGATSLRAIGAARAGARRNNPSRNALVELKSGRP
jgi:hypothetical protein